MQTQVRPRVANAPLSYGAFESPSAPTSRCPIRRTSWARSARAGYAGTDLGPPGFPGRGRDAAPPPRRPPARPRRRLRPRRFSEREHWDEDLAGLTQPSTVRRRPEPPTRGRCCATPAGPSASPTPDAAARTRRCASTTPLATLTDGVARPPRSRARRLRARLPPPHVELRRGPAGDRALPRGHRGRAAARQRAPGGGRRRPDPGLHDWGERIGACTSRTCGMDVLARASERADMITPGGAACSARSGAATSTSPASAPRCGGLRRLGGRRAGPRARGQRRRSRTRRSEQRGNRDWLREHAGW